MNQWRHVGYVPKSSITFRGIFSVYNRVSIHVTQKGRNHHTYRCIKVVPAGKN